MIIAGLILLAIAVGLFFWARSERKTARRATATETMACGDVSTLSQSVGSEVGAGSFSQYCEIVGAAQGGPDGAFKAPESKQDAVWSRTKVTHKYWKNEWREVNGKRERHRTEHEEVVSENDTTTPFAVKDDSGTVLVHPQGAEVDRPERVVSRFERADTSESIGDSLLSSLFRSGNDSGTIGFEHEEWIIRPGTRLYVQGEVADRTGTLVFGEPKDKKDGHFMISTRSEEEIVSGALKTAKIASAAAAVTAVVGVGLVIAGIVA